MTNPSHTAGVCSPMVVLDHLKRAQQFDDSVQRWYPSWFEGASMASFLYARNLEEIPGWAGLVPSIARGYNQPSRLRFIIAIAYSLEVLQTDIVDLISEPNDAPEIE